MQCEQNPGFAIIGCGLIGIRRAATLPSGVLRIACDLDLKRAEGVARESEGCRATTSIDEAIADPNVHVVIVSTPNLALAPITLSAARAGKHVLVEKPGG